MARESVPVRASQQEGTYPRPQMVRAAWADLSGPWEFTDAADEAVGDRLTAPYDRVITVPFPPEAPASGIGDPRYHPVVWYRRHVTPDDLWAAGWPDRPGDHRVLVHFGAVDYRADVWAGGRHVGSHEGGHTPFTVDVTDAVAIGQTEPSPLALGGFDLVVRAVDDPTDLEQPRGKQDWEIRPHVIWYERTTGIWQPVWLEVVPGLNLTGLTWGATVASGQVECAYELSRTPGPGTRLDVRVSLDGRTLGLVSAEITQVRGAVRLVLDVLANGQDVERYLWSPESPVLLDAVVRVVGPDGATIDEARSYLGLRTISADGGRLLLNGRPYIVRAVLSQGYWPASHLAAPSGEALRGEVELIKDLGFNTARLHQKIEDPRLLYWADRLGLMVWEEMPSAYVFSPAATARLTAEWQAAVRRDRSHPCVAVWVPMNESWGAGEAAARADHRELLRALYHLTKALDPARPVVSNDGWEQVETDLLTIHDYSADPVRFKAAYADAAAVAATCTGVGPGDRRVRLEGAPEVGTVPVLVTEFGGVSYTPAPVDQAWGYEVAGSAAEFEQRLRGLFGALRDSTALSGWCYTQLTDTVQETNGLTDEHRVPKLPTGVIRAIVRGETGPA